MAVFLQMWIDVGYKNEIPLSLEDGLTQFLCHSTHFLHLIGSVIVLNAEIPGSPPTAILATIWKLSKLAPVSQDLHELIFCVAISWSSFVSFHAIN